MVNFANSKIYAIRSYKTERIYVGSTTQPLSKRLAGHTGKYRMWLADNSKKYYTAYEILKYPDAYIELIVNCPCENKEELRAIEGQYIRSSNCVNKCIAGRTNKQWQQDNAESIKAQRKQRYQDNKEAHNAKTKQYYQNNREAIKAKMKQQYQNNREAKLAYQKKYSQENSEALNAKAKQYRQDNKEKIQAREKQPIMCSYCNTTFQRGDKSQHIKRKKHIANYKAAFLECFGEPFTGTLTNQDY